MGGIELKIPMPTVSVSVEARPPLQKTTEISAWIGHYDSSIHHWHLEAKEGEKAPFIISGGPYPSEIAASYGLMSQLSLWLFRKTEVTETP